MDIFQTVILAFIQGLTEFLPVSSSAHLVIFPKFFDWPDQGLAFDVVLHFASLCAVIIYYRASIVSRRGPRSNRGQRQKPGGFGPASKADQQRHRPTAIRDVEG